MEQGDPVLSSLRYRSPLEGQELSHQPFHGIFVGFQVVHSLELGLDVEIVQGASSFHKGSAGEAAAGPVGQENHLPAGLLGE